jgi:hypothetical protein
MFENEEEPIPETPEVPEEPAKEEEQEPAALSDMLTSWMADPEVVELENNPALLREILSKQSLADMPREARIILAGLAAGAKELQSKQQGAVKVEEGKVSALSAQTERVKQHLTTLEKWNPDNPAIAAELAELDKKALGDGQPVDPFSPEYQARKEAELEAKLMRRLMGQVATVGAQERASFEAAQQLAAKEARNQELMAFMEERPEDFPEDGSDVPAYRLNGTPAPLWTVIKEVMTAGGLTFESAYTIADDARKFHRAKAAGSTDSADRDLAPRGRHGTPRSSLREGATDEEFAAHLLANEKQIIADVKAGKYRI